MKSSKNNVNLPSAITSIMSFLTTIVTAGFIVFTRCSLGFFNYNSGTIDVLKYKYEFTILYNFMRYYTRPSVSLIAS